MYTILYYTCSRHGVIFVIYINESLYIHMVPTYLSCIFSYSYILLIYFCKTYCKVYKLNIYAR